MNELLANEIAPKMETAVPSETGTAELIETLPLTVPGFADQDIIVTLRNAVDGTESSQIVDADSQPPDLGQRCTEEAFTSWLVGKTSPFILGENIDVITNTPETSKAIVDAVNELLAIRNVRKK